MEESPILSDHEVNDQPEQMLLGQVPKICPVLQILSPYKIHVFREKYTVIPFVEIQLKLAYTYEGKMV